MARLIDADALKELFIQTLENIKSNPRMTGQEKHIITAIHTVGQMIDDAPTIITEGGGRVMNLNNPKTLDEAIEIIKEINPEYEETNTRTAETMVLCAVKDGELVDKHTIGAVPHWIPVSERPVKDGQYIVSLIDDTGLFTDTAEWSSTFGGRWRSLFVGDDDYAEICDINNVVAWMPFPEPYEAKE
jgi:hypothetical protein